MRIVGPDRELDVSIPADATLKGSGCERKLIVGGRQGTVFVARDGTHVWVSSNGLAFRFSLPDIHHGPQSGDALRAPMTGRVVSIPVRLGESVAEGDTVAIIEAMKMEYKLEADVAGRIVEIGASEGDLVDLGQVLVRIK